MLLLTLYSSMRPRVTIDLVDVFMWAPSTSSAPEQLVLPPIILQTENVGQTTALVKISDRVKLTLTVLLFLACGDLLDV